MAYEEEAPIPIPKINHWSVNTYIEDFLNNNPELTGGLFLTDGVYYG